MLPDFQATVWKFQSFSATHILREIKVGNFGASKIANLTFLAAQKLGILGIFDTFKCGIFYKNQNGRNRSFSCHEIDNFVFTLNLSGSKFL